jgi:hypothetical protein
MSVSSASLHDRMSVFSPRRPQHHHVRQDIPAEPFSAEFIPPVIGKNDVLHHVCADERNHDFRIILTANEILDV